MSIVVRIIDICIILIISSYIASKYLQIKDEKTKNRVKFIIFAVTLIAIIVMIIFLIYFCKSIAGLGTVV